MEYSEIFIPVPEHLQKSNAAKSPELLGNNIKFGVKGFDWTWLNTFKIALVGLRKTGAPNSYTALREELYSLFVNQKFTSIIDLGDIEISADDSTGEVVSFALQKLLAEGVLPIVFSENISNATSLYDALKAQQKNISASFILPHANMGNAQEPLSNDNILAHVMADYGRELSTLNVLGYQNYLTSPTDVQTFEKYYCELLRLGVIRDDMLQAEPLLRDADVLCAGVNAVRQCDAPTALNASPNGLHAEEMCRLLRFASFSDKLKACYVGNFNLTNDDRHQTAKLVAQFIWHIIDGFSFRLGDIPTKARTCRKLQVQIGKGQQILFYQSKTTRRWWMEIPVDTVQQSTIIACTENDYMKAAHGEIPDRWLWFYKKNAAV